MGNYDNLELDFIERTIRLIAQYTEMIKGLEFRDQLNYTLTINCLLGLVIMPKERVITFVPKEKLTNQAKESMGLFESDIHESISDLQELIRNLRNSIAHFDIEVISLCENNAIDIIEFKGTENQPEIIARFHAPEILPFLQHYVSGLSENLRNHHI